ncbi:SDR family oxidoreductase [Uliginosibacterium sp. sgz301328]|uniref:SDR family oxidoreductase n=1 Tax=Uliginosibacterium sp. sgz301328 TaxID=3243764 RepID=UPI00359EA5FD
MTAQLNALFDLRGKRALITGSGQGIGWSLARGLASAGASIVLNDIDAQRLDKGVQALRDEGAKASGELFDVVDRVAVDAAVERIERTLGPIDILVNNAGIQRRAPLDEFPPEDWDRVLSVNLTSVFNVSQAVARRMLLRRRGKIINICSVQSMLGRPTIAPYTASKGAVAMLTKGMCADWASHGLQINGIAPGYFATEMNRALVDNEEFSAWLCKRTPAGRWGKVEELCGAAIYLASPASDFVNGHVIYVDGGLTSTV